LGGKVKSFTDIGLTGDHIRVVVRPIWVVMDEDFVIGGLNIYIKVQGAEGTFLVLPTGIHPCLHRGRAKVWVEVRLNK
jgi:hypothetical protein